MANSKEIQELQKDKTKALDHKNLKEAASVCNYLGVLLASEGRLSEAIIEHKQELKLCHQLNDNLGIAISHRRLGECYSELQSFRTALFHLKEYLKIAISLKNGVEVQRAQTTLGRTYFLHFSSDIKANKWSLDKAKFSFSLALELSEKLKNKLKDAEYAEMRCRALLNMALIYEPMNDNVKYLKFLNEAIELAKKYNLKEDVNRCQLSIANFYQKIKNYEKAKDYFDEAIKSAKQLKNKINLCEALTSKAMILICLKDLDRARHCFKKACFTRSPVENDIIKARKCYKQIRQIIKKLKQVEEVDSDDDRCLLYDQIGDSFVELNCFSLAIDYYKKELDIALKMGKNRNEIAIIYISLGQTFLDNDQLNEALECFYKELECRQDMIEETVKTLLKIIEIKILLEKDEQEIISEYNYALNKCSNQKLKMLVLEDYKSYLKNLNNFKDKWQEINQILKELKEAKEEQEHGIDENKDTNEIEIESSATESEISELTDDSEFDENNEESSNHVLRPRKQTKKTEFKLNEKGETPLHRACIENKLNLVIKLIERGHPVNPRDNAGWLPIHEAANHGYTEIVEYLIENGAFLNDRGGRLCNGTTPLHDACTNGHLDVVRLLMKNGASVVSLDDDGNTPLDCFQSYHERTEKLTDLEEVEYQTLLEELKLAMKKSGFDLTNRFLKKSLSPGFEKRSVKVHGQKSYLLSSSNSSQSLTSIIDLDEKYENEAAVARREYKAAISNLRRHYDPSSHIPENKPKIGSLLNEEENIVEDWLEKDVDLNVNRKRPFYDLYEMRSLPSKKTFNYAKNFKFEPKLSKNFMWKSKYSEKNEDEKEGEEEKKEREEEKEKQKQKNKKKKKKEEKEREEDEIEKLLSDNSEFIPILVDNVNDNVNKHYPVYNKFNTLENKEFQYPFSLPKETNFSNSPTSKSSISSASPSSNLEKKEKLLINMYIDGKIFLITVPNRKTLVSWLADQTVSRYYQMKQMKPVISLTTKEGALLSLDDYVVDVAIDNKIYATIDSWNLEPLSKRYEEQCKLSSIKPLDDLMFELKTTESSFCLKLTNVYLPSSHFKPLVNSLKHQTNLKLLDFSFSNIILHDFENELIKSLTDLEKLEKLNLKGTGLDKTKLNCISRLKLSLERLNLSYNLFDDSCITHLVDLLSNCVNLKKINLKFNDFTNSSSVISFLNDARKNSNLNQIKIVI